MGTGFRGTFVISWSQTEIDGVAGAPDGTLTVGATWRWSGQAVRVDGSSQVAELSRSQEVMQLHQRAARAAVRRYAKTAQATALHAEDPAPLGHGFTLTDGRRSFRANWIAVDRSDRSYVAFSDDLPPRGQDLWVVQVDGDIKQAQPEPTALRDGGIICFTAGTRIATPRGSRRVEDLRQGDLVQTKDDGAQPLLWSGARRMSGARLFAMPNLRPIRIRAGALGVDVPDGDVLVSPNHRMVVQGQAAQALFNAPEVLVRAGDLRGLAGIGLDTLCRDATYVHLMFERHQILFANGVQSESFHPADADLNALRPEDKARLLEAMPGLDWAPEAYGGAVRRPLNRAEAALLRYGTRLHS